MRREIGGCDHEVGHGVLVAAKPGRQLVTFEVLGAAVLTDTQPEYALSKLVRKLARFEIPSNRPIVGDMLFKVESGIISSWLGRCQAERPVELFPFHWEMVGQPHADVVVGKGNGRDSITYRLRANGIDVASEDSRIDEILARVKTASLKKHALLSDTEFKRIASAVLDREAKKKM